MYRVAVIQNESEMLRSGFTNVIPKLNGIKRLSQYSFELFNVVNIQKLFEEGDKHLKNFDSLLITTNATSDKTVLTILQSNKNLIADFISNGKGIFIGSQKKLSISDLDFDSKNDFGKTKFLPDVYDFFTVERPKEEKDSGEGSISINNNQEHILLQYPTSVTAELTKEHCEHNEFKKHFYRSHIVPTSSGSYLPIFEDTSYEKPKNRKLLMINLIPQNGERIIISTIAIDWEFHENLLTNIITYVTEGLPKVAFIDNATIKHGDFDFLLTTAKLSKIPHVIYDSVKSIRKELFNKHNTYIFSPDWKERDISNFLKGINSSSGTATGKKNYVRVYYFKQIDNILTLTQYSNFSTIDLITDSSVEWVNSKYENKMWNSSFWVTYDILIMLYEIGVDIGTYITPILKDIRKHYADFSYDGVTGATCGLIELLLLIEKKYPRELSNEGYGSEDIKGMLKWLTDKFSTQSTYDKQTVILTLNKYHSEIISTNRFGIDEKKYKELVNVVKISPSSDYSHLEEFSEIDLCRNISVCIVCGERENEILELLRQLKRNQNPSGKWTNTGRTAHALVFLLNNFNVLKGIPNSDVSIDDLIYNGILYLRSEYNWKNHWDNDIQATAKAIHAIGLYNKHYKYSTQDFFKTLEIESDKIYSASVLHNVSESMRNLRQHSNEMIIKIEKLIAENAAHKSEISEQKKQIEANEQYEGEIAKQIITTRTIATIFGTLFIAFIFYLTFRYPLRVSQEFRQIDITGIILGFIVGLVLTNVTQKTVGKSELLKKVRDRKKLNKK